MNKFIQNIIKKNNKRFDTYELYLEDKKMKSDAHKAVSQAVKSGIIYYPSKCENALCNNTNNLVFHHYVNYEPEHYLHVCGLCRSCHLKCHCLFEGETDHRVTMSMIDIEDPERRYPF